MKSKIIFILFLCTGLFFSCNQDESPKTDSEYFVKFKVNNANVSFPGNPSQPATFFFDPNGEVYAGIIQGFAQGSNGTKNAVQISFYNEEEFEINKTYELQNPILYNTSTVPRVSITYFDAEGKIFNAVVLQQDNTAIIVKDRASIRFKNIGNGTVEGTFEGLLMGPFDVASGRGNEERLIASGEFKLPLIKN